MCWDSLFLSPPLFFCCDKTLWSRQFIRWRVYFGLQLQKDNCPSQQGMKVAGLLAGRSAESSHLKPQATSRKSTLGIGWAFSNLKSTQVTPPSTRSYLLSLPKHFNQSNIWACGNPSHSNYHRASLTSFQKDNNTLLDFLLYYLITSQRFTHLLKPHWG